MRPFRQGDILLVPVPKGTANVNDPGTEYVRRRPKQGIIIAEGEASGHHHRVNEPRARLIRKGDKLFLRTAKSDPVVLTHEEHDDIVLPANTLLEVVRQREHIPAKRQSRGRRSQASSRRVFD